MGASRHQRILYTRLVWVFIVISAIGVGVLVYESLTGKSSLVLSSLIVFAISIAALIMSTLQVLSATRQVRLTENILRKTNQSSRNMAQLVEEDRKLGRDIRRDMALDQEVIAILEEYGVGNNVDERRRVAERLSSLSKK